MTQNPPQTLRVIGSTTIAFGLVSIPVKIYSSKASETAAISFHQHHDADNGRLKQQLVCTTCQEVVEREHTVKGYEHAEGQSVIFSAAELEALDSVAPELVQLAEYTGRIDERLYDETYYLGPSKGYERAYQLLADALYHTGMLAIGTQVKRAKEKLVAIRPVGPPAARRLVLHELRFAAELRDVAGVPGAAIDTKTADLVLAEQLIARYCTRDFDASKYKDTAQARVLHLIESKVAGGQLVATPAPPQGPAVDLLEALKASLDIAPRETKAPPPRRSRATRVREVAAKKKATAPKRKAVAR